LFATGTHVVKVQKNKILFRAGCGTKRLRTASTNKGTRLLKHTSGWNAEAFSMRKSKSNSLRPIKIKNHKREQKKVKKKDEEV
jgi:hypothetical protein